MCPKMMEDEPIRKGFSLEKPELRTKAQLMGALKGFIQQSSSTHLRVILKDIQPGEVGLNLHFIIALVVLEDPFLNHFSRWGQEHEFESCAADFSVLDSFYERIRTLSKKFFLHSTLDFSCMQKSFFIDFPNSNFTFKKPVQDLTSSRGALLNDFRIKFPPSFSLPFPVPVYRKASTEPEDDEKCD